MLNSFQIVQEFRGWFDSGDPENVACTRASDVEQVTFARVNLL